MAGLAATNDGISRTDNGMPIMVLMPFQDMAPARSLGSGVVDCWQNNLQLSGQKVTTCATDDDAPSGALQITTLSPSYQFIKSGWSDAGHGRRRPSSVIVIIWPRATTGAVRRPLRALSFPDLWALLQ